MYRLIVLVSCALRSAFYSFFFNDTATPEIYTLSLHDALPISVVYGRPHPRRAESLRRALGLPPRDRTPRDRKSTRLNSSHRCISYAVFCLKKKKKKKKNKNNRCTKQSSTTNNTSTIEEQ